MPLRSLFLVLPLLLLVGCGGGSSEKTGPLTVAAASSLRPLLSSIGEHFEENTGKEVRFVFGSSGSLFTQINQGAPFDLFIPADPDYLLQLQSKSLTTSPIDTLAWGKVGFISPLETPLQCKSLILPDPAVAPYGRAANGYLEVIGYQGKILLTANAAQVVHQVQNGWSEGGLTAWSLIHQLEGAKKLDSAPEIPLAGASLTNHPHSDQLMDFMRSEKSKTHWLEGKYRPH